MPRFLAARVHGRLSTSSIRLLISAFALVMPVQKLAAQASGEQTAPSGAVQQPAGGGPLGDADESTSAGVPKERSAKRDPKLFARFDALRDPTWTTQFPSSVDTVTGDVGGYRSWLADRGIDIEVRTTNTFSAALTSTGAPRNPQVYNGQRPTLQVNGTNVALYYKIPGLGDTLLNVLAGYKVTTFAPDGPTQAGFRELTIYHGFMNRKIEIEFGYAENFLRYAGLFGGGNPILTAGLGSLIPIQTGLSAEPAPTPTFNLTIHGKGGTYFKGSIQRSENPLGLEEAVRHEGIGLKWSQTNAKALYIGEVGLQRAVSPTQRSLWLRAGYMYNESDYPAFLGGPRHNTSFYALGDYQLTQPDKRTFFRGLYVGASFASAPASVNVYARSGEVRAYYVGPFSSRPTDAINFTATYNKFSDDFHKAYLARGENTEGDQWGMSVAYSIHAHAGLHIAPTVQYLIHPTVLPGYRNVLIGALSTYILW